MLSFKCNKKKTVHHTFSNALFALRWQFKIAPGYTAFTLFQAVLGDVITLFEHTFLLAHIVTCVEQKSPLKNVLYFLLPVAAAVALKLIVNAVFGAYIAPGSTAKIQREIHLKLYSKAKDMDLARYDDTEFYNDYVWAMQKSPEHITATAATFNALVSKLTVSLLAGAYIVAVDARILLLVAIVLPITFFLQRAINKRNIKLEEEMTPGWRRFNYVARVFYLVDFVKDLKTGNLSEKLQANLSQSAEDLQTKIRRHSGKIILLFLLFNAAELVLLDGVYLSYLFYNALVLGKYGLGTLIGVYNSVDRLVGNLNDVCSKVLEFQNHSLYVQKMRHFLETPNKMPNTGTLPLPKGGTLALEEVTFTYPGNPKPTLNKVSLTVQKGEKIALVGFNGAGKSTLIKLLLRLYDPDSGAVLYNGKNIQAYPLQAYRRCFGTLLQDHELLATDLGHNLTAGLSELEISRAEKALKQAAFWERFCALSKGYQTPLTTEFNEEGYNPSGGEKQKIALARVLYANADIIILDEPSGALDPIAEYRLNKTVRSFLKTKSLL